MNEQHPGNFLHWLGGLLGLLAFVMPFSLTHSAHAAPPQNRSDSGPRSWATLTPAQQTALQPLREEWRDIEPPHKMKWIEIANRFKTFPAFEQARIQGRMAQWAQMTPGQRGQTRFNYREAQQLSPEERKRRWEAYNALTPEERQALAARADSASAPARRPRSKGDLDNTPAKSNLVQATPQRRPTVVTPSVVQTPTGATTILVTRRAMPPAHQQVGSPKIATSASLLDRDTLLPRPVRRSASASAASAPEKPPSVAQQ